jgi:predicted transporter
MDGIINTVVYGAIGLVVMYLLLTTIVLPNFNSSYNYTVTGLSATVTQGLLLLTLVLALIGFAVRYLPKFGKK